MIPPRDPAAGTVGGGVRLTASQIEMLRSLECIYSHGVRLKPGSARDALRLYGLIVGQSTKVGHGKSWMLTAAGRAALAASTAESEEASR